MSSNNNNQAHFLDRLLKPQTIALVGVSARPGAVGNEMLRVLRQGGFSGQIFLVNPNYQEIDGIACFPSLSAIPASIDMAVLSVAGHRMEELLDEAIDLRVGGVTIFDYCMIEGEKSDLLLDRLKSKAKQAGMPICGGNCMGYYNFDSNTHVSFQSPSARQPGHIALIAHSGSIFVLPTGNDPRFRFNLVVSAGQEISTSLDQYMDFALEQPTTRVLAVFMEAIRNPQGFVAVLEKAKAKGIPVIVTKVGRTEVSAQLAATHSGAIAGNNTAYEALFKKYGVICTETLDDLMTTALVLSQGHALGGGELGYVSDSGGLRELFVDTAENHGVPFARINQATVDQLRERLPHGLEPVNPLDAAGSFTADYAQVFRDCLRYIMSDPAVAVGVFEFEARDNYIYMPAFIEIAKEVASYCDKPFFVINTFSSAMNAGIANDLMDANVPLVNGVENAVKVVRNLLKQRDMAQYRTVLEDSPANDARLLGKWKSRIANGVQLSETESLNLLADFGIPVASPREVDNLAAALAAAEAMGYPVVLKTAEPGIHHKSDVGGVKLNLAGASDVQQAYNQLREQLGPRVTIEPMVAAGIELAFGMVNDPQFGPMVMVGSGGIYIEILKDRCFSLAPFDQPEALRMLDSLKTRPLLDGVRGQPAADLEQLSRTLAQFSRLAAALADVIAEIDINPLIVGANGCIAVDALIIARETAQQPQLTHSQQACEAAL
ncbi:acetate--CoA ligase family protein [Pseudomonas sp. sp1636]|uniref:acetate--CoA ligase family protein n=1 Tax=Pseudomonas sp. sp1636 TaxID=3036707 RepID=UPI0025A5242F|nr:acetate--CoA ligase family protein [Pseudomonas sp. sp1636]MDM8350393.1 acetate--CoA ligase family protein [Pseudomonas sp. sp1636]